MPSAIRICALSLHDALPIYQVGLRVDVEDAAAEVVAGDQRPGRQDVDLARLPRVAEHEVAGLVAKARRLVLRVERREQRLLAQDRKSTRLNSSHLGISYAVCHPDLRSFPTRRSSDLSGGTARRRRGCGG